ncbi:unannotated protein [freshwater metagenome]|uniref:Unannotated protein n=1 Tax=freshwater metagenome TaxID=449393 RepID=A0A6J7EF65_9ZZZZ|nr:NUDIX domain-containing protein [Actinomycetota bacterium]
MASRRGSKTELEFSAGGVVVRVAGDGAQCVVIVPSRRAAGGRRVLALPKGHPDGDETPEQAALREVREETGVEAEIVEPLETIGYWYQRDGRRIRKSVAFFLLRHLAGDPEVHRDHEIDEARWMPIDQAAKELTYPGDRKMVRLAAAKLDGDAR